MHDEAVRCRGLFFGRRCARGTAPARNIDTEHEVLTRRSELRRTIAEHVEGARKRTEANGDLGALRTAIGTVFDAVCVRPVDHPITDVEGYDESVKPIHGGAYFVEPHLREFMVVMTEEEPPNRAILRHVPLHLPDGAMNTGRGVLE